MLGHLDSDIAYAEYRSSMAWYEIVDCGWNPRGLRIVCTLKLDSRVYLRWKQADGCVNAIEKTDTTNRSGSADCCLIVCFSCIQGNSLPINSVRVDALSTSPITHKNRQRKDARCRLQF